MSGHCVTLFEPDGEVLSNMTTLGVSWLNVDLTSRKVKIHIEWPALSTTPSCSIYPDDALELG